MYERMDVLMNTAYSCQCRNEGLFQHSFHRLCHTCASSRLIDPRVRRCLLPFLHSLIPALRAVSPAI